MNVQLLAAGVPQPFHQPIDNVLEELLDRLRDLFAEDVPCPHHYDEEEDWKQELLLRVNVLLELKNIGLLCIKLQPQVTSLNGHVQSAHLRLTLVNAYPLRQRYPLLSMALCQASSTYRKIKNHQGSMRGGKVMTGPFGVSTEIVDHRWVVQTVEGQEVEGAVENCTVPTSSGYVLCSRVPAPNSRVYIINLERDHCSQSNS